MSILLLNSFPDPGARGVCADVVTWHRLAEGLRLFVWLISFAKKNYQRVVFFVIIVWDGLVVDCLFSPILIITTGWHAILQLTGMSPSSSLPPTAKTCCSFASEIHILFVFSRWSQRRNYRMKAREIDGTRCQTLLSPAFSVERYHP
jgi:hypothetical protein